MSEDRFIQWSPINAESIKQNRYTNRVKQEIKQERCEQRQMAPSSPCCDRFIRPHAGRLHQTYYVGFFFMDHKIIALCPKRTTFQTKKNMLTGYKHTIHRSIHFLISCVIERYLFSFWNGLPSYFPDDDDDDIEVSLLFPAQKIDSVISVWKSKPLQHTEKGVNFEGNILGSVFYMVGHARDVSLLLFINIRCHFHTQCPCSATLAMCALSLQH